MLNELYRTHRSFEAFNIEVAELHPWVKPLGKADLLIASVDRGGFVQRVEHLGKEEAVKLRKIQESNHSNFPQLNWPTPVWKLDRGSPAFQNWQSCPEKDVRQRISLLREACEGAAMSAEQHGIVKRVREFCSVLQPRFALIIEPEFAAFPTLIERVLAATGAAEEWVRLLSDAALASAEEGLASLALVETLLAGDLGKTDGKAKVPILLDLADCTDFSRRIASPTMGVYYSRRLNESENGAERNGRCALSGVDTALETDKMPSPRLPLLGDTVLMSMNRDTPCQMRYGRIGMEVFPVGKRAAKSMNSALSYLTRSEREGKNWKAVPGAGKKNPNLLVVYLETSPEFEADIAAMFTGGDESDASYEAICKDVCEALRGHEASESALLSLFVLNKIDPGRVQVELSETFSAAQAIDGAAQWRIGARNRPSLPLKEDGIVPSPTDVLRCLQMDWERGAAGYANAPGCRLADIYDVLIAARHGADLTAESLLHLTIQRTSELMMAVGHAAHRGGKNAWKGIARQAGRSAVIAASILGILLNKLECRKEFYMQDAAFLMGRFLSLADTLHAQYCDNVRKGDMPPQLLGNALIPTAIGDPNKGLGRMLHRFKPYYAWARGPKGSGLAKWSCGEMGKIAEDIAKRLPDRRLTDREQAQLLLGYVARPEKGSAEGAQR